MVTERWRIEGGLDETKAATLSDALRDVWGIQSVAVDPSAGAVSFSYDERAGSAVDFQQAIEAKGFRIRGVSGDGTDL